MKRLLFTLAALLPLALVGCGDSTTDTAEGDAGRKLTITVPAKTEVTQGESRPFSVGIHQEGITEPIQISFEGLPKGVGVKPASVTVQPTASEKVCTLEASADAAPVKDHKVNVTARSGALKAGPVQLRVVVLESLATKQANKKAFESQIRGRLAEVDKKLAALLKGVGEARAEKRPEFFRQLSELHEERARVEEKVKELEQAPIEDWENPRDLADSQMKALEQAVDRALSQVKG